MQNPAMHRRLDFKAADPAWDELEARWMATLAARGDGAEDSAASLFRAYNPLLLRRLRRVGMTDAEAEDAAQALWVDLIRASPGYAATAPVRHFMRGYLEMACLRFFSKRGQMPTLQSLTDEGVAEAMDAALQWLAPTAGSDAEWFDFMRCVRRALDRLERRHGRLASLLLDCHVAQWSLKEAAVRQGGTADQAKADVFSARTKIEPWLKPCLELWPNRHQRGTHEH